MQKYCGSKFSANIPYQFSLQNINGVYGDSNMFCRWTAIVADGSKSTISINFTSSINDIDMSLMYELSYNDGRPSTYTDLLRSDNNILENVQQIYFYYHSPNEYNYLPFMIDVKDKVSTINYLGLFIALGAIIVICTLCSIFFYKCSKAFIENAQRRMRERRAEVEAHIRERELADPESPENIKMKNMDLLDQLLKTNLKGQNYKEKMNVFKSNCTVCLEEFNSKSDVVMLECKHIFHSDCLKDWLIKNILKPKCPNCNYDVLMKNEAGGQGGNIDNPHNNLNNNVSVNPNRGNNLALLDAGSDERQMINYNNNLIPVPRISENDVIMHRHPNNFLEPEQMMIIPRVNNNAIPNGDSSREGMNLEIHPLRINRQIIG